LVITREWLEAHATRGCGWTKAQLDCIGVGWPPLRGWRYRMTGTQISDWQAREFERLGALRRRKLAKQAIENDPTWGLPL